jgi:hypothetical protein
MTRTTTRCCTCIGRRCLRRMCESTSARLATCWRSRQRSPAVPPTAPTEPMRRQRRARSARRRARCRSGRARPTNWGKVTAAAGCRRSRRCCTWQTPSKVRPPLVPPAMLLLECGTEAPLSGVRLPYRPLPAMTSHRRRDPRLVYAGRRARRGRRGAGTRLRGRHAGAGGVGRAVGRRDGHHHVWRAQRHCVRGMHRRPKLRHAHGAAARHPLRGQQQPAGGRSAVIRPNGRAV